MGTRMAAPLSMSEVSDMTPEQFIKGQVARYAIDEAVHHGGTDNMCAVAHVLRNRIQAGWQGGDWMRVLEDAGAKTGTIVDPPQVNLHDMGVRIFLSRVDDIFAGREPDMVSGALYYAELHNIKREWFKRNITSQPEAHPRVATVGAVAFFK